MNNRVGKIYFCTMKATKYTVSTSITFTITRLHYARSKFRKVFLNSAPFLSLD